MVAVKEMAGRLWAGLTGRPGWAPLLVVAYVLVAEAPEETAWFGWRIADHQAFAGSILAFASYQAGEILDEAIFDSWLRPLVDRRRPRTILAHRCRAWKRLGIWYSSYKASMSLLRTAGGYDGTWVEGLNEGAKFARGAAFLFAFTPWVVDCGWPSSRADRLVGALLGLAMLLLYGYLKPRHIGLLFERVSDLADEPKLQRVDLDDGIRLFFWGGVMACSAQRLTGPVPCHADQAS